MSISRSSRRRCLLALVFLSILSVWAGTLESRVVSAHPLGNFTINHYSGITISRDQILLRYVVDMAEIPAFQEMQQIDVDRDGNVREREKTAYLEAKGVELARQLYIEVNGLPIGLTTVSQELGFPPGQGGLPTLRLSMLLSGAVSHVKAGESVELYYRDGNYIDRLGWREIVVRPGGGVSILHSTAPDRDRSHELRSYPEELLNSPPAQREAHTTFALVGAEQWGEAPAAGGVAQAVTSKAPDSMTSLVTAQDLSFQVVVISLIVALGLGAAHALSPGHGKAIMAAYLVGARGTAMHALLLGLTVTVSHTIGVFGLGLVVLYASHLIAPELLYPWLGLTSGLIITLVGVWLLISHAWTGHESPQGHDHHSHPHTDQTPHNARGLRVTWQTLTALGVVGGLVPSVSALIILLAAISLHRVGFGLLLILAFSAGMAAVLSGIGLLLVYAGRVVERVDFQNKRLDTLRRFLPLTTGLVVLISGLFVAIRSVFQLGLA